MTFSRATCCSTSLRSSSTCLARLVVLVAMAVAGNERKRNSTVGGSSLPGALIG